ncbi:hypothetical protein P153DRAFT_172442 [Dothidotthia symphoricarpi CBS 119687]|uniref:Uncharacterized protein n=1 Tax=Dothidotthia symphoricarpi CBS 119687 TaxID=1392245 RepID=A0A6A6AMF2_9PLEO|nr:uncharacterized protein P153DRAFT_172442 [Dothidotthia symphoricarpi CBS 119687]KAF2132746.1 hypothetical protein P153DRAFT_172442 [Dothidotthia symphoricarpi CBS 119687]
MVAFSRLTCTLAVCALGSAFQSGESHAPFPTGVMPSGSGSASPSGFGGHHGAGGHGGQHHSGSAMPTGGFSGVNAAEFPSGFPTGFPTGLPSGFPTGLPSGFHHGHSGHPSGAAKPTGGFGGSLPSNMPTPVSGLEKRATPPAHVSGTAPAHHSGSRPSGGRPFGTGRPSHGPRPSGMPSGMLSGRPFGTGVPHSAPTGFATSTIRGA